MPSGWRSDFQAKTRTRKLVQKGTTTSISKRFRHLSGARAIVYPAGRARTRQTTVVKRLIQSVRQAMAR
jgi:hypothetical protein